MIFVKFFWDGIGASVTDSGSVIFLCLFVIMT